MKPSLEKTSKLISYWLRHKPEEAGLAIDDFGWTSTDQLLKALHIKGITIDFPELLELNSNFDKVRWEIDQIGARIRATHGHFFPVLLDTHLLLLWSRRKKSQFRTQLKTTIYG